MLKLEVRNLRALRAVDLPLDGVTCVVGANGVGKTTLLAALYFLRVYLERSPKDALDWLGVYQLKNRDASEHEPIEIGLFLDDAGWRVAMDARGNKPRELSSVLLIGGRELSRPEQRDVFDWVESERQRGETTFRRASDGPPDTHRTLVTLLHAVWGSSIHYDPDLHSLRTNGSKASQYTSLSRRSENAFAMLRRWNERLPDKPRFEFVLNAMRAALPDLVANLDFESASDSVFIRNWRPGAELGDAVVNEANGFFSLLTTLTAVAAGEPHSVIAVDEPENGLHPYAIARMVDHVRRWSDSSDLAVLFTTHSPVLLNQFRNEPARIVVFERGRVAGLDALRDPSWLDGLLPGELYENLEFGAPKAVSERA